MSCFKEAATKFGQKTGLLEESSSTPFAEAASALRSMITRAPQRFANDDSLSILESKFDLHQIPQKAQMICVVLILM